MFRPRSLITALRSALSRAAPVERMPTEPGPVQSAAEATTELDPSAVRNPRWGYAPVDNGALDAGEIVWTWVPYEEKDGRGKDRPVVIVAALAGRTMLAVALTSKDHTGDDDYVALGIGPWDRDRRPSWAAIDRVFSVSPGGVRREGASVDAARYSLIESALRARYGWR